MFAMTDPVDLWTILNQFPVPMFAAQRRSPAEKFRLLCINEAHTKATGLTMEMVENTLIQDLLAGDEANQVEARYSRCVDAKRVINYHETLHLLGKQTHWETTLQPIDMPDGAQRVIGTALSHELHDDSTCIDDAEFFAVQAQMQLGHVREFLNSFETRPDLPQDARERAMMVNGLTRGLDRLLFDLRLATRRRRSPELSPVRPTASIVHERTG